jgi:hypothetical protein
LYFDLNCLFFVRKQAFTTLADSIASASNCAETESPSGPLFQTSQENPPVGTNLVGLTGSIRRTFGPRSNADAALATGGAALAAHSSFDPCYERAQSWIRHHAVGWTNLSPVLITGLSQSLSEAAFPHAVWSSINIDLHEPLIVGVEVVASIEVEQVTEKEKGFYVVLKTKVETVRDQANIASGKLSLWIPDYMSM